MGRDRKEPGVATMTNRFRGGDDKDPRTEAGQSGGAIPILNLFQKRDLMIFLVSVVLFHFANAAMLPMAGQVLAKTHPGADIVALSACIITAQLVMIGIAAMVGWAIRRGIGRKKIFLVAFLTLPIRGFLFTLTDSPYGVVAIQLLDGSRFLSKRGSIVASGSPHSGPL
jgi:hypothetical protein